MSLDTSEMEWAVRLSAQLKSLSEVTEKLTYRLLELEERVAGQHHQWSSRCQALEERHSDLLDRMQARLQDTDERLGRLEGLLRTDEPPAPLSRRLAHSPLRALSSSSPPPLSSRDSLRGSGPCGDDLSVEDLLRHDLPEDRPLPDVEREPPLAS